MTEAERRACTGAVTRFRMYIRESVLGKAEDAAETARDAADKAWLAALEARRAAVRAEETAVIAEGAFKRLKAEEPRRRADYDGDKTPPATPRWSGSNGGGNDDNMPTMTTPPWEGSDSDGEDQDAEGSDNDGEDQDAEGSDSNGEDQGAVSAGASEHESTVSDGSECQPPNESISMEDFPEHRTMLDSDANRIGAGFPDIVLGQPQAPSVGELRADLDEAVAELKRCKREMPGLRRKDDGCGRKLSHCRDKISKGISEDMALLRREAYQQASDLKQGARDVQAAVRWVRARRWSLNMVGEMPNKRTRLSHVESAGSGEDA